MNLPAGSLNYKAVCTLPNCGRIPAKYKFYLYLAISGPNIFLDIDLSGGTAFNLEVFACSL
jgi:hypothetical protein